MLVLSRAVGELISIGDDISVRVLSVSGTTVRFGVEAPRHIDVHRFEIYEKIQRKKNQVARKA
ncbi:MULTISPECIES: carbon storage regulator CsrA [Pseudomonas]|jgi:carbon storage regulator|nr:MULTISPECIES: carbon storage regulator CsrA [Pseudomonas]MBL0843439.1 carbon storage regulator CsrA [Pseudomonas mediterranea]MDU9029295.1 carbon storage regulator CsrA [Pseudomonas mediterranea]QHA81653.1 carbon storage regulator CsrA [Pseudomonas mediterranea]UVL85565.1 carbon storage regulator CsrA [Pseudomonas sp. B21-028]UZE02597.1 carbon storage regulator CsrA [Pseudomonas mediterranea]